MEPTTHLKLAEGELDLLARTIEDDYTNAIHEHQARMNRFRRYYRYWRSRIGMPAETGKSDRSNFKVPLIMWTLLARWAKEVDALLGDDAEIIAKPVGPMDEKGVVKIGRYMTWRVFSYMQATLEIITLKFYKLLFGRAFAYCPYKQEREDGEVIYDGPDFSTLWMDDFITPAEEVKTLHEFSWVIRKFATTLGELLKGEAAGLYFGIKDNFKDLYQTSQSATKRDDNTGADRMTEQRDRFEGVDRSHSQTRRENLIVWAWYGSWRLPKNLNSNPPIDDFDHREIDETELCVYVVADVTGHKRIIGVQKLKELYPKMKQPRPFIEEALTADGSYWCAGLGEFLEDVQLDVTTNHNLGTDAGEKTVNPVLLYVPGSGFEPKKFKWEPGMAIPVADLNSAKFLEITPHMDYTMTQQQLLLGYGERLSGITDMNLGRAVDRPNAPKTARQTLAFLDEGNSRLSLDNKVAREYARRWLQHLWQLDCAFASPETFFRVTEEQAGAYFETNKGFAKLTTQERAGQMDFEIRFASSSQGKEARKEEVAILYQTLMATPIIQTNASAQWLILDDFLKAFNQAGMKKYMPKPAETDMPVDPEDEWVMMLQGDDVDIHPLDDDVKHLEVHQEQLARSQQLAEGEHDPDAEDRLITHIMRHTEQQLQKEFEQAQQQALSEAIGPLIGEGIGQALAGGGMEGAPVEEPPPDAGGMMNGGMI